MPFLVTKLPGAGPVYKMRDRADGAMKEITYQGTIFGGEPLPDPWYSVAKLDDAAASLHAKKLAGLAVAAAKQDQDSGRFNAMATLVARYELLVAPLDDVGRDLLHKKVMSDAAERSRVQSEIDERVEAEPKRIARAKEIASARLKLEEDIGELMADGSRGLQERQDAAEVIRTRFERAILDERAEFERSEGREESARRLEASRDENWPALEPAAKSSAGASPAIPAASRGDRRTPSSKTRGAAKR